MSAYLQAQKESDAPTNRSKAAGLRSSRELSSFKGVRHFWQNILWVLTLEIQWFLELFLDRKFSNGGTIEALHESSTG